MKLMTQNSWTFIEIIVENYYFWEQKLYRGKQGRMNHSFNSLKTWHTYAGGANLTFHSMHPTLYVPWVPSNKHRKWPWSYPINTQFCFPSSNVIFSYDLEGNVTLLELIMFTLCKHTLSPPDQHAKTTSLFVYWAKIFILLLQMSFI